MVEMTEHGLDAADDGRRRAVIEDVRPQIDGGRFPVKRVLGDALQVEAAVFCDGHDRLRCLLQHRRAGSRRWQEVTMEGLGNDRWRASFRVTELGRHDYRVMAWVDPFESWRHDLARRSDPEDVRMALLIGADLVDAAVVRATGYDAYRLEGFAAGLRAPSTVEEALAAAESEELARLMAEHADRSLASTSAPLQVVVDRERARYGAWYEMFPRSCAGQGQAHGSLRDCEARLPYVAEMGFDILYLPPIHPIGHTRRKGPNNTLHVGPEAPGSPWAIGSAEGGHKAVHPALGTVEDLQRLAARAREYGIELALDIAFQCSPDHPYVEAHPEWFAWRPDGTVQYAENPPKKYQDIYPFNFEAEAWPSLWQDLKGVFDFWIEQGVRIFRVDNPHTKPFAFWEWALNQLKAEHPDLIFLSEAFARPRIMHRLAKLGFSQSYTYFAWRNTKWELTEYASELTRPPGVEYLRPNLWPNTPDILTEYLQFGGRPAFMVRLVLAATMSPSYGIYGPAFELQEDRPLRPGSEEYLDSEKYQVRHWDLDRRDSLKGFIARVNAIRRDNPALKSERNLRFYAVDNDELIAYGRWSEDASNLLLIVVNLDPYHRQSGWLELPISAMGLDPHQPYQMHDLLSGARHLWHGERNYVELDPHSVPAHIFRVRRRVRSERDFEYFL